MNRIEAADRFAHMWRKSRNDAGKSQEYMAKMLGVSKKTVQNWEDGISCPNQLKGFEWFSILGLQPLPYYLELLYPEFSGITPDDDDDRILNALLTYIRDTTPDQRRKLLYILYGDHGSSPAAIIEMVTAHLHAPLRSRLNVAQSILTSYEVSMASGDSVQSEHVQPDTKMLNSAIETGIKAAKEGRATYTLLNGDDISDKKENT